MKSLGKNAFYNVVYKGLNVIFPLITMAYVSRVLLPIGVGKVASAQNIVTYFVLIASLGLPTYGVKIIAGFSDDRKKSSKAFSELFAINAISTIICSFIYVMMILSVEYFQTKIAISLVVGIQLFANIINIDWLYQGFEEYRYITIRSTIVKLLSLFAVFVFIKEESDYIVYAFITALSLVANFVLNVMKLKSFVSLMLKDLNLRQHLKPVFALLASTIAIEIYVLGGTTILSVLKSEEDVAFYTYASKAINVVRTFVVAICAVFLPRLNYYYSHEQFDKFNSLAKKGILIILNLCVPAAIGLYVLSEECVQILFGSDYLSVIPSMQIMSITLVTIALSNFTGYQILVTIGKERFVLYSTIIGAIINLMLNFVLVSRFGHFGAALSAVITEGVIAVYQFWYVRRFTPLRIGLSNVVRMIIPSISMLIPLIICKLYIDTMILRVILCIVLGGVIFAMVSYKMKNVIFMTILTKLSSSNNKE